MIIVCKSFVNKFVTGCGDLLMLLLYKGALITTGKTFQIITQDNVLLNTIVTLTKNGYPHTKCMTKNVLLEKKILFCFHQHIKFQRQNLD